MVWVPCTLPPTYPTIDTFLPRVSILRLGRNDVLPPCNCPESHTRELNGHGWCSLNHCGTCLRETSSIGNIRLAFYARRREIVENYVPRRIVDSSCTC